MPEKPLYEKKVGYTYRLYPNRLEIRPPALLSKKITTILVRSISRVEIRSFNDQLYVITRDNETHTLFGITGPDAHKMRAAILLLVDVIHQVI
ncbi:MAG TPA: hypothetical protein PLA25_01450 [Anaerolineaceae bacterium]|nr:hypothetical protein [Anaerolineaceae bacterium]